MPPFNFKAFLTAGECFLILALSELEQKSFTIRSLVCDHLCFRVATLQEYALYKDNLLKHGLLLTEAMVNGRPICTFKLVSPFRVGMREVWLLELPAPKSGADYQTGFEHAEFVIQESFEAFQLKHKNLNFTLAGPKSFNPELCLKLPFGQAKFHHLSLDRVIEIEESEIQDIIFDLDGTLIQSRENIYEINRRVFSQILEREVTVAEAKEKYHADFPKLFEAYNVECRVKQNQAIDTWGQIAEGFEYKLFDGIAETLKVLKAFGLGLHLWTARDQASATQILKQHALLETFESFSFASAGSSKPMPQSLNFAWQDVPPNSLLMIGDSPTDIIGARNIQAIAVAALWDPESSASTLVSAGAEICFDAPKEFAEWLCLKNGLPI